MADRHTYASKKRYQDKAIKQYTAKFHRDNDSDVIAYLESQPNKNDCFRQGIRLLIGLGSGGGGLDK